MIIMSYLNDNYKLSVIITVYNGENDIENCFKSLLKQTIGFENLEIIIHNDASTDKTLKILEKYADKYDNVKVTTSKTNRGCGGGRNVGLREVTSDYVAFVDIDDELTSTYFETLYNTITENDVDIVQCEIINKIGNEYYMNKNIALPDSNSKIIFSDVNDKISLRGTCWGGMFKYSLLKKHDIKCPEITWDDGPFFLNAAIKADKIILLDKYPGYIYDYNMDSVTHAITSLKPLMGFLEGFKIIKELFDENNLKIDEMFNSSLYIILFMFIKFNGHKEDKIKFFNKYRDFLISLNYPVKLNSAPLNMLNEAILKGKYNKAILLSNIAGIFYNNTQLRTFLFKKWCNLKEIEEIN